VAIVAAPTIAHSSLIRSATLCAGAPDRSTVIWMCFGIEKAPRREGGSKV
jgi:hypothetical protein